MKPRLQAEWVQFREELWILASCCLRPIRRNSVLEELRVSRLAVIQEEICCKISCRRLILEWKSGGRIERKSCVSSAYRWWFREFDEIRVLRGVVYMMKSNGPKTEPWGTPQREVCEEDRLPAQLTRNERDDRYDLNQSRTVPWIPNQEDRRERRILWSMVSKAAERSSRQRHDTCCEPIAFMRWSWM